MDDYVRGDADYTASQLVKPDRIDKYTKQHWEEMEEDVSDRLWAFQGQTKHIVLERIAKSNPERYFVEQRWSTMLGKKKISAMSDLFDKETRILYDWKETSVWKFILGDTREWEEQANINLFLMRVNDYQVDKLINVAMLKDWKARLARTTKREDYPQCALHVMPLPMWSVGEAQDFINKKIAMREESGDNPPVCTKRERWQRDAVYALMKKGNKRAIRLYDNKDQAEGVARFREASAKPGEKFYIEERPTEPVRCLDFCPVQQWCDFGRKAAEQWRE
jgi:hypothetical protein